MASFNNGNITATVTPPQGYTGDYEYELQELVNGGVWVTVNGTDKGFTGTFINPVTTSNTTYTFGNPGGFDDNQEGSGSWVGLAPAQYKIVVTTSDGLSCEVEGTGTVNESDPNLPVFTCNDANFQVANGTTGDTVSATADLGILVSVSPANYLDGNNTYTATITIPAGYQNAGNQLTTCTDTATGTATLPIFECTDANFQVANGTTGDTVTATVSEGALESVSPSTYQEGSATYTATITIPAGYQDAGSQLTTCTDTATGTTTLTAFDCGDTTITIANGTEGNDILTSAVSATGITTITAVYQTGTTTPATYINGTTQVDVVFQVPAGYSNTDDSFTCSANATGIGSGGGGTDERTWYYFHGIDDDWLRMTGGGLLDASSYGLFNNGTYSDTAVGTLTEALTHYFANSTSLSNGMDIEQFEMNESITNNGEVTQIVFNDLINGEAGQYYYLLVPDNNLFPENLTTAGVTIFPWPGLAGNAADRLAVQISGVNYYIYQLQGSTSIASRTCSFS